MNVGTNLLQRGRGNIARSFEGRQDARQDALVLSLFGPEPLQRFFVKEHRSQIRLRIEINGQDTPPKFCTHPRNVIDQGCLPDTPLVVEESDRPHRATLLMVAKKNVGSVTMNSAGAFP